MQSQLYAKLKTFRSDENGTVALIFVLSFIVLLMMVGLAVDTGRAMHVSSKVVNALDTAALAAAKGMRESGLTDAEVAVLAQTYFDENMKGNAGGYGSLGKLSVEIDRDENMVALSVVAQVPTTFGRLAGVHSIDFPKSSSAIYNIKDIEVALALDVTGSMSGSKLSDLKTAAKDLVEILIPDEPTGRKIRVGLAPYAASVNAGPYAAAVSAGKSLDGCVLERFSGARDGDHNPVGAHRLAASPELNSGENNHYSCPRAQVHALSDDKDSLKFRIDGFQAGGYTAGHLGAAWSWYLLSPKWSSIWPGSGTPAEYKDDKTIKAMVLMTDGAFNTSYIGSPGGQQSQSFDRAASICANAKAEEVLIYTVGFKLTQQSAIDIMKTCASSPTHAFLASDGESLRDAFRKIAISLAKLRLAK